MSTPLCLKPFWAGTPAEWKVLRVFTASSRRLSISDPRTEQYMLHVFKMKQKAVVNANCAVWKVHVHLLSFNLLVLDFSIYAN